MPFEAAQAQRVVATVATTHSTSSPYSPNSTATARLALARRVATQLARDTTRGIALALMNRVVSTKLDVGISEFTLGAFRLG